jgi:hypothetical protein
MSAILTTLSSATPTSYTPPGIRTAMNTLFYDKVPLISNFIDYIF